MSSLAQVWLMKSFTEFINKALYSGTDIEKKKLSRKEVNHDVTLIFKAKKGQRLH